jgi:type II secretory pathway pseudopilin PulG
MKRRYAHRSHAAAFTVAECLISLAISALLMTAVAVAFNASLVNFRENEEMFESINHARQALSRMTSQLRTGQFIDPNAASTECSFYTSSNEDITYEYRAADKKLYLITNSDGSEYTLCDDVTAASFTRTLVNTPSGLDAKSVLISLTVQCGNSTRTLSAAAVIRRNLGL